MNDLLQNLIKLQSLDFEKTASDDAEPVKAELRSKIPMQILGHYDRLIARGKKGLAGVRDQVCTSCHMRVPIGVITTLMRNEDIQLCDNCGRYLYLLEATTPEVPAPAAKPVTFRKPRKAKAALQPV